nr:LamG domain-containing protein [Candidatus Neomarinimicrobiota bacterium]
TSSCPGCIVLYIDKESLSKYKTDNYLLLDPFEGHRQNGLKTADFEFYHESSSFPDFIDLTENAPTLGDTFTIEMWIWSDQHGEEHQRIIGPNPYISLHGKIATDNGSEIRYGLNQKGIRIRHIINKVDWYHIAVTFDRFDDYIFYLNGEEVSRYKWGKKTSEAAHWDNATRYIGGKVDNHFNGGTFLGKIDDVRMWNVVRSQEEIQETIRSRNQPKTGNEPGYENLVAYYPMDLNDDNATWELVDLSPRKNNVKIGRYGPLSRANISSGKFTGDFIINEEIRPRYFSDDCPDGPDGSLTCPYPTIRSAMDDLHKRIKNGQYGGYHLYVREGRYTEVLNKWHLNRDNQMDMSKVRPIVFEGYPNEKVIIDGTVALNDNSSNWEQASHLLDNGTSINIYKTVINFDNISREIKTPIRKIYQVFVNDRYMIPAMPMNFKNPTDNTTGNPQNPEPNTIWSLSKKTEEEKTIEEVEDDNSSFYDNATKAPWGFDKQIGFLVPNEVTYVPGSLEFLDAPEEWAFDSDNKTLYLYASDNFTPNSTNVRIRVRDRFLNIRESSNIKFKNIDFSAGSINLRGSKYFTLEDCKFSFSSDMGLLGNSVAYSHFLKVRNCIFEYINDGHSWAQGRSSHTIFENVLFRYNDWFGGTAWSPNSMGDSAQWRYITIENSYTAGLLPGPGSLVEYARIENLYEGCDCSGIQRNADHTKFSTTRFSWIINSPGLNGMRFDSKCGARFGDVHNIVSLGNRRGFRLKGDNHDVYHTTAYDNTRQDISLNIDKYCGPDKGDGGDGKSVLGNWNSNIHNVIAEGSFQCFSEDCWAAGTDPMSNKTSVFNPWFDFPHLDSVGIWFGRLLAVNRGNNGKPSLPWATPIFELEKPWIQMRAKSESFLLEKFGANPWSRPNQDYDFRPKKGSYLIDSGVIIPGINDGNDKGVVSAEDGKDFNHPPLYSGQKRKYVGNAPDIGAYEYGDSVYWIPGYRYPHPSVPIPNDNASDVPIDYSLVWNYPYKKDYSNTEATVTVSRPGVSRTVVYQYPNNVHFQTFDPGETYNWSVTVDNVSGGNWSFKTDDKIYPLNDRSVDTTDKTSLIPYQMRKLEVSNNTISFLRFDIPSTITDSHKINLKLVVDGDSTLNSGISIHKYGQTGWGESPNSKNIGIIDHSLGATLATLTPQANGTIEWDNGTAQSLDNGTILSIDLTDKITSYGEEYSIGIRALGTEDKVTFFSKEKQLNDGSTLDGNKGLNFAPQVSVWPNISFK